MELIKNIMEFDYRTEITWKFVCKGYKNAIITSTGMIKTSDSEYYDLSQLVFEYNTPLGLKTTKIEMKDLRDLINKEQGEKLPFIQEAPKVDIEEVK